ncbi:MAG: ATP-binding cassette domain-containing protein [Cyclobacteriaceae bacterium]|nr:ATP-binding cassette domain-containing protein [Cyclobacteriaceae bacterium]
MKPGVTIDFNNPVIEIEDLWKSFGSNHVLKGFNLTLHQGENIAVMGKSGSGKSVLIKCIIGLLTIDKGKLSVLGKAVPEINHKELDELRTDVGFQFQGSALYDSMTVRENLEFPLRRHREKLKGIPVNDLVMESLENVGLAHAVDMMPEELSGGMKKRVALARTLIMRPKIILYDEPTSGLDPVTGKEISLLINEIQVRFQTAAIVITHDLGCAKITSDRMIILHNGINYTESTYSELNQSTDEPVKAFFT